jgi:hypothetical protein
VVDGSAKPKAESLVAKERDLYTWVRQTATLLREGRVGDLDLAAVAEEIDDVGEEQYLRLESALRVLMHHLLKWIISLPRAAVPGRSRSASGGGAWSANFGRIRA